MNKNTKRRAFPTIPNKNICLPIGTVSPNHCSNFSKNSSFSQIFYPFSIYIIYTMKQVELEAQNHLEIDNIEGFLIRKVTKFGNGAKVDCPKEYLGRTVYLVII